MCVHIIRLICHENEMRNSKNAPQIPKLRQSTKLYFPSNVLCYYYPMKNRQR